MLLSTVRLSFLLPPIVRHFRRPVLSIPSVISRGAELFALEIISPPVACVDEASIRSVPIAREEIIDFSLLFYPNIERPFPFLPS